MPWNSTIIDSEILAVHAALVPNGDEGEVVLFGGDEHWGSQGEPGGDFRKTKVYDVKTHSLVSATIPSPPRRFSRMRQGTALITRFACSDNS